MSRQMRRQVSRRHARGFTLIEVLLAVTLLVAGLALAFATIRSAMAISQRGEAISAGNERIRAVESLLRRRLSNAMPIALQPPEPDTPAPRFIGEPQRMQFAADVPAYLGRGGAYVHTLAVSGQRDAQQLTLELVLLQDGVQIPEVPARAPEVLADALQRVEFRYRGIDPVSGDLADWQPQWDDPQQWPLLVSISVDAADGRRWPPLVVAMPQGMRMGGMRMGGRR